MPRLDDPLETDPLRPLPLPSVRPEDPDLLGNVEAPSPEASLLDRGSFSRSARAAGPEGPYSSHSLA